MISGTLSHESLARALEHASNRPRLRWNMLSSFGFDEVYARYDSICARFQCLPLRVEPGEYVEVALVDPTWKTAVHEISERFGLPVHAYVISYTDYLYLARPALRPSAEDSLEFGETLDEAVSVEAIELLKRLREDGGLSAADIPPAASETPPPASTPPQDDAAVVPSSTGGEGDVGEDAAATAPGSGAALAPAPSKPSATTDAEGAADSANVRDEDATEVAAVPRGGRTPYSSPQLLEASEAFAAPATETEPTMRAIQELLDAILEIPIVERSWLDVFDIFSMLGTACVRGVRVEGEMYIGDLWIDGVRASILDWTHVGQMLYRVYPERRAPLSVLQLEPRHRNERDVTGYVGTNAVMMHHGFGANGGAFFAVIGVSPAWIRKLDELGAALMRRDAFLTLLQLQRGPGSSLVRVI